MSLLSENDINSSVSVSNLEETSCSSPFPLFTNYFPDSPQMHFEYEHVYLQFLESTFHQQQQSIFTNTTITTNTSDAYATSDLDNNINNMFDNEGSSKTEENVRKEQEEDVVPIRKMEYVNNNKNNYIVTRNSKKDRHSKINTARGPRDRRMRLSLEVARKFFDLQDMLRFDKPSKTVDWLLKNSSHAIRELAEGNSCEAVSSITSNSEVLGHSINYSSSVPFPKKQKIASLEGEKQASSCDKSYVKGKLMRKEEEEKKKPRLARTVERESRRRARERARERTSQKRRLCETIVMTTLCRSS